MSGAGGRAALFPDIIAGKAQPDGGTSASAAVIEPAGCFKNNGGILPAGKQQRFVAPLLYQTTSTGQPVKSLLRATSHPATIRRIPNRVRAIKRERNEASVRFDSNLGPLPPIPGKSTAYLRARLCRSSMLPSRDREGAVSQLRWGTD